MGAWDWEVTVHREKMLRIIIAYGTCEAHCTKDTNAFALELPFQTEPNDIYSSNVTKSILTKYIGYQILMILIICTKNALCMTDRF